MTGTGDASGSGDGRESTDATEFDALPPRDGVVATLVAATVAVGAAVVAPQAGALAAVGAVAMAVGVQRGRRRIHDLGATAAFAGVLVAAAAGAPPILVLVGAGATLLAWDLGEHAVGLGRQVGNRARSRRNVLAHAGTSGGFVAGVVVVSGAAYLLAGRGRPGSAAVVLAAAAGLFAIVVER